MYFRIYDNIRKIPLQHFTAKKGPSCFMGLLSIFSFAFSFFILWNTVIDIFSPASAGEAFAEEDDDELVTREGELMSLLLSALMNLGWMGYVYYTVHTPLSGILYAVAPLFFIAEMFLLLRASDRTFEQSGDFIAAGMFFLQVYFSLLYLAYCLDLLWSVFYGAARAWL